MTEETKTTLETAQLTVEDLQALSRVVDLATRRGAFQAGELSQVGTVYDNLVKFLAYVESNKPKEEVKTDVESLAD